jgi:hypothetical protein
MAETIRFNRLDILTDERNFYQTLGNKKEVEKIEKQIIKIIDEIKA